MIGGASSIQVRVCMGACCVAGGSYSLKAAIDREVHRRGLSDRVSCFGVPCSGLCARGPILSIDPGGFIYGGTTEEAVPDLVREQILGSRPLVSMRVIPPESVGSVPLLADLPFFRKQLLVVLKNKGLIDPERIEDSIARDGYLGVERAIAQFTPEEVIEMVIDSGLRGRGGAGFPTGVKWRLCREQAETPKYVVANCDEGDPGAYMDRSLLESDPHAVIEGMAIAAYAIGAARGYVYIRTEYPLAIQRMRTAIEQARGYGLLGERILGVDFEFHLEIREGSGAFVCGEETSLIHSIEGAIPEPRQRPPFPATSGLWGHPTVINNVETLANIPVILTRGPDWYARVGTTGSKGTKIFSLVGKIENTGLIEVPMGITVREIVEEIGGGIPGGKRFKAVQTGGPSGGCIPAELMDLPIDYDSLRDAGSMMGSGGMIVLDEETCVVDVAKFFLQFTNDESCGKCVSCRDGSAALLEVLTRICDGEGRESDLAFLEELALAVKDASMCGLGQSLPNPILSTLQYFRDEYVAHVRDRSCPALACKNLIKYTINPDRCPGCAACLKTCPAGAIRGGTKLIHVIDTKLCTKCGLCLEVCPPKASAVRRVTGKEAEDLVPLPDPIPVSEWRRNRPDGASGS